MTTNLKPHVEWTTGTPYDTGEKEGGSTVWAETHHLAYRVEGSGTFRAKVTLRRWNDPRGVTMCSVSWEADSVGVYQQPVLLSYVPTAESVQQAAEAAIKAWFTKATNGLKGLPGGGIKKCRLCKQTGHNAATCGSK